MMKLARIGLFAALAAWVLLSPLAQAQAPPGDVPPATDPGATAEPGPAIPPEQALTLDQVIAKLQENYGRVTTYQVDFDQELFSATQGRVISKGNGSVMYKKPGKMVWNYKAPEEHVYITDGNTLYDYAPAEKEAYILPLRDATIKAFLLGLGDVRKDFEVSFHEGNALTPSGLYQLDMVPKDQADRDAIGTVTLYLSPQLDYMVQFTEMVDALGNHNRMRFKNMRINVPLGDELFKFTPPPGVKVTQAKDLIEDGNK